jgi:hypothetical protein
VTASNDAAPSSTHHALFRFRSFAANGSCQSGRLIENLPICGGTTRSGARFIEVEFTSTERSMLRNANHTSTRFFESQMAPLVCDLRRYARSLTRDAADADDLLQETMIRAYMKFHLWQPGTNLAAWLVVMMRRLFLSKFAQSKSVHCEMIPLDDRDGAAAPSQQLTVELRALEQCLHKLSHDH